MAEALYIGTSGWSYPGWKNGFYKGVPRQDWLCFCAQRFTAIEVNATFYGLRKRSTFAKWRDQTPAHFRFAVKGNRFLTHTKKLVAPAEALRLEQERAAGLGKKLAAVLWQLPRSLARDTGKLRRFAEALEVWDTARHAMEFRHPSWFVEDVAHCLSRHRIAVCLSDAADWPMWEQVTTDMVYVRLHGHSRTYASAYTEEELREWAGRVGQWRRQNRSVHVYFDNDAQGAAPLNALRLLELAGSASL